MENSLEKSEFFDGKLQSITEFYKGKVIFITGGTGFMGKVLIEKLLWSCPEIKTIYLLLRSKKGVEGKERLAKIEKSPVFDRIKNRDPQFFMNKVKMVDGDVCELGLGLSAENRQLLINEVSIIYHVAASVRFDDTLKSAVIMNARGTREMMMLAKEMKNIKLILHVSTTYCNTDRAVIDEILYPSKFDWQTAIKMAETMDEEIIQILTPKIIGDLPNTYVFTKGLGEQIINDLRGDIPTVICRPSIVVSSLSEPMPGWVENFNGPVGLLVACGKGIMRSMYSSREVNVDLIPVDVVIKAMILASWNYAVVEKKYQPVVPVVNCSSARLFNVSYHKIIDMGITIVNKTPLNNIFWKPGGGFTKYKTIHNINFVMFHLVPAFIADTILKLSGNKPILWKLQRRVYVASQALLHYIENDWLFKNNRFLEMRKNILSEDLNDFDYPLESADIYNFFKTAVFGARRYLLNEPDETIPQAKIHYKRMSYLDQFVKIILLGLFLWFLYSSSCVRNCAGFINTNLF